MDGEILETLWAPLNEISRSGRGMGGQHRREMLDHHMDDSNWKKLLGIRVLNLFYFRLKWLRFPAFTICKKYKKAIAEEDQASNALFQLDKVVADWPEERKKWVNAEKVALNKRRQNISMMDIYDVSFPIG